jgi:hypothetical protein
LYQGLPTVCGGYIFGAGYQSDCLQLVNGTWNSIPNTSGPKSSLKSVVISSPEEDKELLVVAGGWYGEYLSTVESFDGQSWNKNQFEQLPEPVYRHCLVKVNDTMLISIGGSPAPASIGNTNVFDVLNNKWTPGPQLITPRTQHACGVMNWRNPGTGNLEKVVVAAGGAGGPVLKSVELLFMEDFNYGWVAGPDLPKEASSATMVEFQGGVILIGGSGNVGGQNLYQLDSPTGTWTEMKCGVCFWLTLRFQVLEPYRT